jgi:hypothetical protein
VSLDGVYGATWLLNGGAFDQTYVGSSLVVAGSLSNNGAWVVASVLSPSQFTTVAPPTPEVFPAAFTASFMPPGFVAIVPDTMNDWLLYAELFAAITVLDKQNLDSTALQARLAQEKARIVAARAGRRDQPYQVPMRRPRAGGPRGGGGWGT